MTTVEALRRRLRRHPHAAARGRPPAHRRGQATSPIWPSPGALHLRHPAQPLRPRPHQPHRPVAAPWPRPAWSPPTPAPTSASDWATPDAVRLAGHRRTCRTRPTSRWRVDTGELRRRRGRRRAGRTEPTRPTTPLEPSSSTTTRCRPSSTSRPPWPTRCSCTPTSARTPRYTWELVPGADAVERAFADGGFTSSRSATSSSACIPMADGAPGVLRGPPALRRRPHPLLAPRRSRTSSRSWWRSPLGIPEQQLRVVAPSVGGGFGSQARRVRRGAAVRGPRPQARPARCAGPRSAPRTPRPTIQGRGQIQDIELAADADGQLTAVRVELIADMGGYLQLVTPRHPAARRLPLRRRLRPARCLLVPLHAACSPP